MSIEEIYEAFLNAYEEIHKKSIVIATRMHNDTEKIIDKEYQELYEKYEEKKNENFKN